MADSPRRVAIIGGARIPFARVNSAYIDASNQDMLTAALRYLVEKYALKGERLGEVAAGAVIKRSRDWTLAREWPLGAGLPPETPAYDLQRACGTSLSAVAQLANRIAAGEIDSAIAGGSDTASDVPLSYRKNLQRTVLRLSRAKTFTEKVATIGHLRPRDLAPDHPGIAEPRTGMSMGEHCEEMAKEWQIGRREQDELALASHQKAAAAWQAGFFNDLVFQFNGLKKNKNVPADTSLEKISKLRTAFQFGPNGTLTAGNTSPLTHPPASMPRASEERP